MTVTTDLRRDLAIEVRDLVKRFGDFTAVDGISFDVRQGEIFGFLGPNGAGKSTTIRMLTTLLTPTAGVARVNGYDLRTQEREVRHSIGVIPQAMTSDMELTAWENMEIHAKFFGLPKGERKQRITALLERVGLYDRRDSLVRSFSGGMRRRLEIARGLVQRPAVLFLDEPTTGLDPASRHVIWELLEQLRRTEQISMLLTTHYMDEADVLSDRIAIMNAGKIVVIDTPDRLKASVPGNEIIQVAFSGVEDGIEADLRALPGVQSVRAQHGGFQLNVDDGGATAPLVLDAARRHGQRVLSLTVKSTTIDDVFLYYTGAQLGA
jgi:ABC-2 type transport system ATP-binding protein